MAGLSTALIELPTEDALRSRITSLQTRAQIEAAIIPTRQSLAKLLLTLDHLWNIHISLISSLPEELLSRILIEAVAGECTAMGTGGDWQRRVGLSLVCQRWRAVALSHPAFWAGVRLHLGCKGLAEMLPRWKGHPRAVNIDLQVVDREALGSALFVDLLAAERLVDLHLTTPQVACLDEAWKSWPNGWKPRLRSLDIRSYDPRIVATMPAHFVHSVISPALEHLKLNCATLDWKALEPLLINDTGTIFANLVTLVLTKLTVTPPARLLNHILSSAQHLRRLDIDSQSFPSDFEPNFRWKVPCLTNLHLSGPLKPVVKTFLLTTSAFATYDNFLAVQISAWDFDSQGRDQHARISLIAEMTNRFCAIINRPGVLQGMKLCVREESTEFCIQAVIAADQEQKLPLPSFSMGVNSTGVVHISRSPLTHISVPLVEHVLLDFRTPDGGSWEEWREFFDRHRAISTLELTSDVPEREPMTKLRELLRQILSPTNSNPASSSISQPVLLLKLYRLCLVDILAADRFINILEDMLVSRWQAGLPVRVVEIQFHDSVSDSDSDEVNIMALQGRFPLDVTRFVQKRSEKEDPLYLAPGERRRIGR